MAAVAVKGGSGRIWDSFKVNHRGVEEEWVFIKRYMV
jgi:hypothetical protein